MKQEIDKNIIKKDEFPAADSDRLDVPVENRIITIRRKQVMIDRDLAELYGVDTKRLNEQVKRNIERFPENFRFQLTTIEKGEVVANCDHLKGLKETLTALCRECFFILILIILQIFSS